MLVSRETEKYNVACSYGGMLIDVESGDLVIDVEYYVETQRI